MPAEGGSTALYFRRQVTSFKDKKRSERVEDGRVDMEKSRPQKQGFLSILVDKRVPTIPMSLVIHGCRRLAFPCQLKEPLYDPWRVRSHGGRILSARVSPGLSR